MAVDVSCADGLVEQRPRLQRGYNAPAQSLAAARMACTKVNDLKPVRRLSIPQCNEAIPSPHLVLGRLLRIPNPGLHIGPVRAVEFCAKDTFRHLLSDSAPGEPQFDTLSEFTPRFPGAPDQCRWVEARRPSPFSGPPANTLDNLAVAPPLFSRI